LILLAGTVPAERPALSDQPADVRAFAVTAVSKGRKIAVPRLVASVGIGAILAIATLEATLRGPWLDEFWTLELSDASDGLIALIRDGWLRDAHPPLFSAWATLLSSLGVTSIAGGRLISNLLAAALMLVAARRLSQRTPDQTGF